MYRRRKGRQQAIEQPEIFFPSIEEFESENWITRLSYCENGFPNLLIKSSSKTYSSYIYNDEMEKVNSRNTFFIHRHFEFLFISVRLLIPCSDSQKQSIARDEKKATRENKCILYSLFFSFPNEIKNKWVFIASQICYCK